jgi:hypothetical protein
MNTTHNLKRTIVGALLSSGLVVASLGLALAGTAQADDGNRPNLWCPGDSMQYPTGPGPFLQLGHECLPHLVLGRKF